MDATGVSNERQQRPSQARESWPTVDQLVALPNDELAKVDPVVMNLVVAKGIPALGNLDIGHYVGLADHWAAEIEQHIPAGDANFYRNPERLQNDLDFSRLAVAWWYVEKVLRISYRKDQRGLTQVLYTNPTDLFLNGVMDTMQGTCGNMAALYVALCWRLGWPVSLACVGAHHVARYDDGQKTFNVEVSRYGEGCGICSPPDRCYMEDNKLPQRAVDCGSDLRAVTPREMLGLFVGLRARHLENKRLIAESEPDYLLARYLFPKNRHLHVAQGRISVQCSMRLLEPHEKGHPIELSEWLQEVVRVVPLPQARFEKSIENVKKPQEKTDGNCIDAVFEETTFDGDFMGDLM